MSHENMITDIFTLHWNEKQVLARQFNEVLKRFGHEVRFTSKFKDQDSDLRKPHAQHIEHDTPKQNAS